MANVESDCKGEEEELEETVSSEGSGLVYVPGRRRREGEEGVEAPRVKLREEEGRGEQERGEQMVVVVEEETREADGIKGRKERW